MSDSKLFANWDLIKGPAIITLVVTIARFVAELAHAPKWLANADPGGGAALLGISWLPVIFGIYFAVKLTKAGKGPADRTRAWEVLLGCLIVMSIGALAPSSWNNDIRGLVLICQISLVAAILSRYGWEEYANTLLGYAVAARIPVVIVMAIATYGNLHSHYNGYPPFMDQWSKFGRLMGGGFFPQMTFWIGYTVVIGAIFGLIATAITSRIAGSAPAEATPARAAAARAAGGSN